MITAATVDGDLELTAEACVIGSGAGQWSPRSG
jgi:hypothetical protein